MKTRTFSPAFVTAAMMLTCMAGSALAQGGALAPTAETASDAQLGAWGDLIAQVPQPHRGCFTASYPDTKWMEVACAAAPMVPFLPRQSSPGLTGKVGNGNDYSAAVQEGLTFSAAGMFPAVSGVTSESEGNVPNKYSLQLNSQFFTGSPECIGAANFSKCQAWQQFIYASTQQIAFMQYWLIDYDNPCPSGWTTAGTSCWINSDGVQVGLQDISQLQYLKLEASAFEFTDKLIMVTKARADVVTASDTVLFLQNYWQAAEFNIFGDGGGSVASFNKGSSITVKVNIANGRRAPDCVAHGGTTGETNNLTLGKKCTASGGKTPAISFTESN